MNQETKLAVDGNAKDVNRTIQNYPINYFVQFDIKCTGKANDQYMSVFHVTSNDSDSDYSKSTENTRNPGLWICPKSTKLAIAVGIPTKYQLVVMGRDNLETNKWYTVTIDVVDNLITMKTKDIQKNKVVDTQTLKMSMEEMRLRVCHPTSVVQIADKWYQSAPGLIRNFQIFDYTNNSGGSYLRAATYGVRTNGNFFVDSYNHGLEVGTYSTPHTLIGDSNDC
jgi:hypothetical protein